MSDFNIDVLFAEQDERMALPDEDLDAYLNRVAAFSKGASTLSPIPLDETGGPGSVPDNSVSSGGIQVYEEVPGKELRNVKSSTVKRKPAEFELSGVKRRKRSGHEAQIRLVGWDADSAPTPFNLPPFNLSIRSAKESPKVHVTQNNLNDDPHTQSDAPLLGGAFMIPGPPAAETTASQAPKRKTCDEEDDSYPHKKIFRTPIRSSQETCTVSREYDSPIGSFPRTLDAPVKTASRKAPVSIAKVGGIEFLPLHDPNAQRSRSKAAAPQAIAAEGPVKRKPDDVDPPTSPIEDMSISVAPSVVSKVEPSRAGNNALASESKLYLEVKERVAKHALMKKRDKVLKLATKALGTTDIPERQSSSKGASPYDESDIICLPSSSPPSNSPAPPSKVPKKTEKDKNAVAVKSDKSKSKPQTKKKIIETKVKRTLAQYVLHLQEKKMNEVEIQPKKKKSVNPLKDMYLFYASADRSTATERTRGRLDFIMRYGGNLLPIFDPAVVTHIIVDTDKYSTLRALGMKRLQDIPAHIPTLRWEWVTAAVGKSSLSKEEFEMRMNDLQLMHAAFSERIDAGFKTYASRSKGKARRVEGEGISRISEFTQDKLGNRRISNIAPDSEDEDEDAAVDHPSSPLSPSPSVEQQVGPGQASSSKVQLDGPNMSKAIEDPLAPFYGEAKAERDIWWARPGEAEESDNGETDDELTAAPSGPPPKRGWTCDRKQEQLKNCPNQDIIDKLEELKKLHNSKPGEDDRWRTFSYSKCIPALRNYPRRIKSFTEARSIRGVGEKTAHKIMEILETGGLRRIGYERTDDVKATRVFQGIYGVGQPTAFQWYSAGCRTLEDIKAGKGGVKLTPAQEIGVRFYEDINDRMPRSEAKAIFDIIRPIALSIDPKLFIEIMGSYRRGKADCGDIDIMITRPPEDGKTHAGVLSHLLRELHAAGIITEDLALPEHPHDLQAIYRGLCKLPQEGARRRRIDFLTIPWQSRGAALLYYTGDDIFNRAIRMKASALGYSLNQKGLFSVVVRDPRNRRIKLNNGSIIASETEEEIFKILGVPWQEPHERVRG